MAVLLRLFVFLALLHICAAQNTTAGPTNATTTTTTTTTTTHPTNATTTTTPTTTTSTTTNSTTTAPASTTPNIAGAIESAITSTIWQTLNDIYTGNGYAWYYQMAIILGTILLGFIVLHYAYLLLTYVWGGLGGLKSLFIGGSSEFAELPQVEAEKDDDEVDTSAMDLDDA